MGAIGYYLDKARKKGFRETLLSINRVINCYLKMQLEKLRISYLTIELSDRGFFKKIDLRFAGLEKVREAVSKRDFQKGKHRSIKHYKKRTSPRFFLSPNKNENLNIVINDRFKKSKKTTIKRAEEICLHEFEFIVPGLRFSGKVDWLSNLLDKRRWEIKYWRDIDYSSDKRIGDVRLIWELNRHQYFVTLGKAYWYTGDEKYAKEFVSQLRDWIETNPYGKTVNWVHAQEVALRIMSWIWSYHFFCDSPSFKVEDQIEFLKSLYLQAEFLRKKLSDTRFSTHNHIISETAGLAMMAVIFPEFKKSKVWWRDGVVRLERELERQICDDGVSGETSTNYHFFVLDSFLQISILLNKNGLPYPRATKQILEKMIEFSMYICRPDGTLPIIGDSDSGRSIRLDELNGSDRRSYLSTGAVLFDRADMKAVAGKFYEESLWLLGTEGLRNFDKITSNEPTNLSALYPDSGYCVMRDAWSSSANELTLRCGAVSIPKHVAIGHNHADYLSFELIIDGEPFIIDPGVYTYNLDDEWRWYGRKTSSHNTVVIDDADQFVINSQRFGLPKIAKTTVHAFDSTHSYDFIHASHDAYESLANPITHHRNIFFNKISKRWAMTDNLVGSGNHKIDWYFHFDVGIDLKTTDGLSVIATSNGRPKLVLRPLQSENVAMEIIDGWVFKRYGAKRKARVLKYSKQSSCPCKFEIEFKVQE